MSAAPQAAVASPDATRPVARRRRRDGQDRRPLLLPVGLGPGEGAALTRALAIVVFLWNEERIDLGSRVALARVIAALVERASGLVPGEMPARFDELLTTLGGTMVERCAAQPLPGWWTERDTERRVRELIDLAETWEVDE